jgi:uncharacterized protein (TIGR02757 family)
MQYEKLIKVLENIYKQYHKPEYLDYDPLQYVRQLSGKTNKEIGGIIFSCVAYGRVEQIRNTIQKILKVTGKNLIDYCITTSWENKVKNLSDIKHRFNTGYDFAILLDVCGSIIREYGSLENIFVKNMNAACESIKNQLENFSLYIRSCLFRYKNNSPYLFFLFPLPSQGSTCKRLNMYLRWMVRDDDGIDCGLWKKVASSKLIMPVDTHIAEVSKRLGFTKRKTVDWQMAEEITKYFKKICPLDPVKYDFSLCHIGMMQFRKIWKKI